MLLNCLPKFPYFAKELAPYFLSGREVGEFFLIDFLLHEEVEDKVLEDFCFLVEGGLGEGCACLDEQFLPPAHFAEPGLVHPRSTSEGFYCSLAGLVVLAFDDLVDFLELVVDVFEDGLVLIVEHFLVLLHLHVHVLDPLQLLVQDPQVVLVVAGDVADRVLARNHPVVLVNRAPVDAVDAQQLKLVFAVEGHEVVVDEAFLGQLVLVRHLIKVKTGAEVLLPALQGLDILRVVLLQQHRGLGGRALLPHRCVGIRRVGQRSAFLAIGHYYFNNIIIQIHTPTAVLLPQE